MNARRFKKRCEASGKSRYLNRTEAMIALASTDYAAAKGNNKRDEVRVYRCPDCRSWHLTRIRRWRSAA